MNTHPDFEELLRSLEENGIDLVNDIDGITYEDTADR